MENQKWNIQRLNGVIGLTPGLVVSTSRAVAIIGYAETQNAFPKWNGGTWEPHAPRKRTSQGNWNKPLKWNAEGTGL
jgi:hypothetical protein